MTMDRMALHELLEKGSDSDVLREMISFVAPRLMDLEVVTLCGAGHGDRSTPERINQRHGDRERAWDTRAGTITLQLPKLRKGSSFPGLREPRRTAEKALAEGLGGGHPGSRRAGRVDPQR